MHGKEMDSGKEKEVAEGGGGGRAMRQGIILSSVAQNSM